MVNENQPLRDGETYSLGIDRFVEYVETPLGNSHISRKAFRVTCEKGYGVLLEPTELRNLHRLISRWMKWNQ